MQSMFQTGGTQKRPELLMEFGPFLSGGGEIRTPVLPPVHPSFYVRVSLFYSPRLIIGQRAAPHKPVV